MDRLIAKKDRQVSGSFSTSSISTSSISTSSISRPMPLRPCHTARNDAHHHGHARSGSVATAGVTGQPSSSKSGNARGDPGALATVRTASRTSLSEWELVDDEDVHNRSSVGSSTHKNKNRTHNHSERHVRHVGSLHHPTAKANPSRKAVVDDDLQDDFEGSDNKEWHSTIESFDLQDVRISTLFTDAEYGREMLFNIFPELKSATKRVPLVPMPVWDKDIRASRLLASVMERQRLILKRLKSDVDADVIYMEEFDKNIKRGLSISRASRHAAEKVMRVVDELVAAKVEEINATERRRAEYQERLRMTEGEVFPGSSRHRKRPVGDLCLNMNAAATKFTFYAHNP